MGKIFKSLEEVVYVKNKGSEDLGEGSFSKVKLVSHKNNSSLLFAMKTIKPKNEKERVLVFKEIQLHSTFDHQNIIRFVDFIETKSEVYIFIEFAKNGDLFTYKSENLCSTFHLTRFFYETCLAIQYLHQKNVMHRDLKPENILLDDKLTIKVCDFGWSTEYFDNVPRETLCGTSEYMAPEILLRKRQTKKTDIWALGILLYELFHGYAPFRGHRVDSVLAQISKNSLSIKNSLNSNISELIVKLLKFYPNDRLDIEQILESDFIREFLAQQQTCNFNSSQSFLNHTSQNQSKGSFLKQNNTQSNQKSIETRKTKEVERNDVKTPQFVNIYSEKMLSQYGHQLKSQNQTSPIAKEKVLLSYTKNIENEFEKNGVNSFNDKAIQKNTKIISIQNEDERQNSKNNTLSNSKTTVRVSNRFVNSNQTKESGQLSFNRVYSSHNLKHGYSVEKDSNLKGLSAYSSENRGNCFLKLTEKSGETFSAFKQPETNRLTPNKPVTRVPLFFNTIVHSSNDSHTSEPTERKFLNSVDSDNSHSKMTVSFPPKSGSQFSKQNPTQTFQGTKRVISLSPSQSVQKREFHGNFNSTIKIVNQRS